MTWYDVKIQGRHDGRPRTVDMTVQARSPEAAVQQAVAAEFDVPDCHEIVWSNTQPNGTSGPLVFTVQDDEDEDDRALFITGHGDLEDVVREVADHTRLALLDGHPELPFLPDGPTAGDRAVRPQRWFAVDLTGETAVGRTVRHRSTRRAATADVALTQALEEVFDVWPGDSRWVKGYPGPALSPPVGTDELYLELIGTGVSSPLTVKGRTLWDIVREVEPPSWARLLPAPDAHQRQALSTWGSGGDTIGQQRLHATLGLVGEAGEVANLVKKQLYKPGAITDNATVIDELADVAYYLAVLAHLCGVTFDGLFAHLAWKLAGGHGWVSPPNSTEIETVNGGE